MSKTQDLSYDEPWPMYADEEEPWKDLKRLLKLEDKMDTQKEIGDALGTTPSTISYWLQKARDEVELEPDDEDLQCVYHDLCGNQTAGRKNDLCTVCMTLVRHNDSAKQIDPEDSDDMMEHMEAVYDAYPDLAEEQQEVHDELQADDDEDDGKDSESES